MDGAALAALANAFFKLTLFCATVALGYLDAGVEH